MEKGLKLVSIVLQACNGYKLDRREKATYNRFLAKIEQQVLNQPVDWAVIKQMQGADQRKADAWVGLEKKLMQLQKKSLPTNEKK